jgi:lipoprotein-anchoring transpeptidase ErfK/SrfK
MRTSRGLALVIAAAAAVLLSGSGVGAERTVAAAVDVLPAKAAAPAQPLLAAKPAAVKPAAAKPAAKAVPAPALVPGTPCTTAARACIDLSAKRAWLIRGGVVQYGPVPITSGRPGYRTPVGNFRVTFKDIDHLSSIFNNAPMPYSVFFNGGIAFHQGSLSVASHGCIHLSRAAARTFFASLSPGNVVQVRP